MKNFLRFIGKFFTDFSQHFSRCVASHWECSSEVCGKRCSAVGDPHYTTFDGKQYDFMGQCSYTMIQHSDFEIETENIPCNGAISQVLKHWFCQVQLLNFILQETLNRAYEISHPPTCTKSIIIKLDGHTLKFKQRMEIVYDGEEITRIPKLFSNGISVQVSSSLWLTGKSEKHVKARLYVNF